jgi:hypothetical protein
MNNNEYLESIILFSDFLRLPLTLKGAKNRAQLCELGAAKINYSPPAGGEGQIIDFQPQFYIY